MSTEFTSPSKTQFSLFHRYDSSKQSYQLNSEIIVIANLSELGVRLNC